MWSSLLSVILVINELMASNLGEAISPAVNFDSWIEVYNPSDEDVDLGGMYLSNDAANLTRWQMPSDIGSVPAKGFKVVWLGSHDITIGRDEYEVGEDQAPFKLDCDGGTIYLSDENGQLIASQEYPKAMSHTAWARKTDGGDEWGWTWTPTPAESNATAKFADKRLDAPVVSVGSKLFTGSLQVTVDIPAGARLMYTTDGSIPSAPQNPDEVVSPWREQVINGDCEGSQKVSLSARNAGDSKDSDAITDGAGVDGSRGIKVHSSSTAKNDYDAQLFVYTPNHIWRTGDRYRFRMMVRADKAAKISAQTHTTPHNYIADGMFNGKNINVTTEWKEYTYEGTITDQQCGKEGGEWSWWGGMTPVTYKDMQTIAFNLNVDRKDNNFYFDNVSWEYDSTSGTDPDPTKESEDGKFTVSSTTNYTFRLYQDGYLPSVPVTRSYIQTTNKYTFPVISIVGNKKYFTDPKIGIDCDGDGTNGKVAGYTNGQARNYAQDWDRPVNFSYIGTDGEMKFNQDVNLSVSGGYTRTQKYRSFKLKSNKTFDDLNRFDYSFFPQKPYIRSKTLLVRNGGNDVWSNNARFTDPALETIIQRSGIDVDVQSYVPIIEYVNGELRGVLNLREPNNDKFAYANWGYDDEELDAFENEEIKNGDDEVLQRIYQLGKNINDAGAYEELQRLLDIDEFTNYMAVTLFLFNDDWPNNNIKAYRSRNDGRYRFISFDLDYAFAKCWNDSGDDPFVWFEKHKKANEPNHDLVIFFLNLLNHEVYRKKFIDTFCLVGGSVFEPNRSNTIVNELLNNVKAMCDMMKKQGINDGHDPQRAADEIKNNLKNRSEKMTGYLKKFSPMQLSTVNRQSVILRVDTDGARILVNGIDVPYADFQGHLFGPVTLEAKAPAGYRFAAWKKSGSVYSEEASITMPGDASVTLTATFTKLSDSELSAQGITPVRINEVGADNGIYVNDYYKRNDWVELYNTTAQPIDVEGMYLSDNPEKPKKYQITKGDSQASTIIPAFGHLVVWCDKLEPLSQLHASFKLEKEGDDLTLMAADESWTDHFRYAAMESTQTAGRYPDGGADVYTMNLPTIGQQNMMSSYVVRVPQNGGTAIRDLQAASGELTVSYAVGSLAIHAAFGAPAEDLTVSIVNMAGQSMGIHHVTMNDGYAEVSVDYLRAGAYVATVADAQDHKTTCKFMVKL